MLHVWKSFIEMSNRRSSNGFATNPISYSEIFSYFSLHQCQPQTWEIDAITKLDNIALEEFAKQAKAKS